MTKKEIFASALELCKTHGASDELVKGLTVLLEPKSGGAKVNVEDVYNEAKGTLLCSVSGKWLPATIDFFYEDKSGKSPFNGLRRLSRQAESIRKTHAKQVNASEKAIMSDVLDGNISPDEGKEKVIALAETAPDYSVVTAELPAELPAES